MFFALGGCIGVVCILYTIYTGYYTAGDLEGYTFADYKAYFELPAQYQQMLTDSYIGGSKGNLSHLYDPRKTPAMWLRYITDILETGSSLHEISLPFSWSNIVDLVDISGSCDDFFQQNKIELPYNRTTTEVCADNGEELQILRPLQIRMSESVRLVVGLNYLKHSALIPDKVIFTTHNGTRAFKTHKGDIYKESLYKGQVISLFNESAKFQDTITNFEPDTRFLTLDSNVLHKEEFESDESLHDAPPTDWKFFFEAILDTGVGEHFDWRFFRKFSHTDYERQAALQRIARAWLRLTDKIGIKTWLAHGSLLGWFWNGMSMPWDNDLDVQLTMDALTVLGNHFNNTLVIDLIDNATSSYLIEVNPNSVYRETSNRTNAIDARFIDTQTGFYIDITALTLTRKATSINVADFYHQNEFNQLLDPEFSNKKDSTTISIDEFKQELASTRDELVDSEQLVNCKDNHFYKIEELQLKPTIFEGVRALIPQNYEPLLKREYKKALYNRIYNSYLFRSALWLWVPSNICKNDWIGLECQDEQTKIYREATKKLIETHKFNLYNRVQDFREHAPSFIDPWMLERSRKLREASTV